MRYIMIGAPVNKVRTPGVLTRLMAAANVEATVETRHVEPEDLRTFMSEVAQDRSVDGLLITMPHKKAIIPYLARMSQIADAAGSVNAAKRFGSDALVGAQFDGVGLVAALQAMDIPIERARILLAGIGGAGLPIAQALLNHGCRSLDILDTDTALRENAVAQLQGREPGTVRELPSAPSGTYDLLINATPLGMHDGDPSPFERKLVEAAGWVADIVADPSRTRLAGMAREAAIPLISGRDMVRAQSKLICRWLLESSLEQSLV